MRAQPDPERGRLDRKAAFCAALRDLVGRGALAPRSGPSRRHIAVAVRPENRPSRFSAMPDRQASGDQGWFFLTLDCFSGSAEQDARIASGATPRRGWLMSAGTALSVRTDQTRPSSESPRRGQGRQDRPLTPSPSEDHANRSAEQGAKIASFISPRDNHAFPPCLSTSRAANLCRHR